MVVLSGVLVHSPAAVADTTCPSPGVQSGDTCTYTYLGTAPEEDTLSIPAGASLTITAWGSPGGQGDDNGMELDGSPGGGGMEQGTFDVPTAQTLTILVGDAGDQASAGGEGGGGFGDSAFNGGSLEEGGKGGGGSYVFGASGAPLVVAGGGGGTGSEDGTIDQVGGAGGDASGGGAGQAGSTSQGNCGVSGGAGGAATVGAPGTSGPAGCGATPADEAGKGPVTGPNDPNVTDGNGGLDTIGGWGGFGGINTPANYYGMGGGGGGGYTGGGGGGNSQFGGGGSGGGGSGFISPSALTTNGERGVWFGNTGKVTITYTLSSQVSIATPAAVVRPDEGKSAQIVFPISLSTAASSPVTVHAATSDGTGADAALAGQDYDATSQTLTFPAGSTTTQDFTVPLIGTIPLGQTETFNVTLSDPANATLGTSTATGTILCSATGESPQSVSLRRRANAAASSPCQLNLDPEAGESPQTAGLAFDGSLVGFFDKSGEQQTVTITPDNVGSTFSAKCLSGCTNVAVHVTGWDHQSVPAGTQVTASVAPITFQATGTSQASPYEVQPSSSGNGYVCAIDGGCGPSATAKSDDNGIAQFRYWIPGIVGANSDNLFEHYPEPIEDLQFSAKAAPSCGCYFGAQGSGTLGVTLAPRIWVNKTATITPTEIAGLEAVIKHNAGSRKTAETRAKDILDMLKGAGVLTKQAIKEMTGIANLGLDNALEQLMGRDPDSVMLTWFMGKFHVASDGLLEGNFDPRAFGQELKPYLVNLLTAKILKHVKALSKAESKIRNLLTAAIDKVTKDAFAQQAVKIVREIVKRSETKPRTQGHATLKLFDVTVCSGQCLALPLPVDTERLFMIVSEVNARHPENFFYPTPSYSAETPIKFTAQRWLRAQCGADFGCDTKNQ